MVTVRQWYVYHLLYSNKYVQARQLAKDYRAAIEENIPYSSLYDDLNILVGLGYVEVRDRPHGVVRIREWRKIEGKIPEKPEEFNRIKNLEERLIPRAI